VFVNPQGRPAALTCYFDDFILSGKSAAWYDGLTISDYKLDLASGDEVVVTADAQENAFSWISTNPAVATVDQDGKVKAITKGDAIIKAIPLYGDTKECEVRVDGGGDPLPEDYERTVILDFENYELDWSAGYGGYAWGSVNFAKVANPDQSWANHSDWVVSWERDGTNYGGGLGIIFPGAETAGWERLSLQAYSDAPISELRIELYNGDELLAEIQKAVEIPVGVWTQVLIDLADMGALDISFNKIHFQYAVGTLEGFTVLTDNVWLEKGGDPTIAVTGISIEGPGEIQMEVGQTLQLIAVVEPDSASNTEVTWSSYTPGIVSVSESGLISAEAPGGATVSVTSDADPTKVASVTVTVSVTPGIAGVEKAGVVLYPNPVSETLLVLSADPIERVEIFNIAGERVGDTPGKGLTRMEIKGLNLEADLYLVRISTSGGGVRYKKIMVIH
ncbi:MAG: Ig-like domain-containing protein, partial [Bacteroidales bacterium]